ncbi:hypothetical protein M8J77_022317 [Diaphorina citri]|nr:hypothetical protein M8J77_022317 [Diaphorina citri]
MTLLVNVELLLQDMAWPISIMEDLNGASKGMTMTLLVNVELLLQDMAWPISIMEDLVVANEVVVKTSTFWHHI